MNVVLLCFSQEQASDGYYVLYLRSVSLGLTSAYDCRLGKIICCWSRRWRRLNWSVRRPGLRCRHCSANFTLSSSKWRYYIRTRL